MTFTPVKYQLAAAGFFITDSEIQSIKAQLDQAVADGTIKQSTVPDRQRYPIGFMLSLAVGRDISKNYQRYVEKAVRIYPPIKDYVVSASYTQITRYQHEYKRNRAPIGITSLTLEGAIAFAAVLRFDPKKAPQKNIIPSSGINGRGSVTEQLAALGELCRAEVAKSRSALENVQEFLKASPVAPVVPPDRPLIIYALRDRAHSVVKIGITDDLEACLKAYKSDNPFLCPIAFFPVEALDAETKLFKQLQAWAMAGAPGWFDDTVEMLQELGDFFLM